MTRRSVHRRALPDPHDTLKECHGDPTDDCREYLIRADAGIGLVGAALTNLHTWADCCLKVEERVGEAIDLHARLQAALKSLEGHLIEEVE